LEGEHDRHAESGGAAISDIAMTIGLQKVGELDGLIHNVLNRGRIPGAAFALVSGGETVLASGYGYRDLGGRLPVTEETAYPIASTSKAITATVLGMLVDEGRLAWDTPVQEYLPEFRLGDAATGALVSVRDLITMRTGLPRHDWAWLENPGSRAELVSRLRYLELSAPFRARFQYSNLTVTSAGHIAEVVTGTSWEELVLDRILKPLGMQRTGFALPPTGDVTLSYHETHRRELRLSERLDTEVTGPSGGSLHSTVLDMARWIAFNLSAGKTSAGVPLIKLETLQEIQAPQIGVGSDASSPAPNAAYAMGWFTYSYNGHECLSHGGYLHDICSDVMLFPTERIGMVCFTNFGFPGLARVINLHAFDGLMGLKPVQTLEQKLSEYEAKVEETTRRNASVKRVANTAPSHAAGDYAGEYFNRGYGKIMIGCESGQLVLIRNRLVLPLEHWHYDTWVVRECDRFFLHTAHAFERASRIQFETDADGHISAVLIPLEPAVAPIRFARL
jgi:CubicO group peptidase (beta-lactamase class C family)